MGWYPCLSAYGKGEIGFDALWHIVHHPDFADVPKILETPYLDSPDGEKRAIPPYQEEIARLKCEKP